MMRQALWALAAVFLASGCQGAQDDSAAKQVAERSSAPAAAATLPDPAASEAPGEAPSQAPPPGGRSEKVSSDLYEFSYSYPDQAGAIPDLKDFFDARLEAARSQLASSAQENRAEANKEGFPFRPHGYDAKWEIVTDLPGWLSLSAEIYTYAGGAHGMSAFDSLLWDRRAQAIRKPRDLFTGTDALRKAIREPFCDALDREREKRRGEAVERNSGQIFTECIDPVAQTLILGSSNGKTFDRIGILVAPYEAGPYAEGSYEITLPVTGKIMATLKPQYRTSFSPES